MVDPFSACEYRERDTRDFDIHLILSFFSQMCVQKVEINLFFFFNGQTYREERKPTKFLLFKWHTHWHTQKRRRKTFFSFSSCVRFMLGAYIYLGRGLWWPMIWTTRTKWRCCCASIIYFIFVILNVRISSVWTTSVRWSFFFQNAIAQLCPFWYVRGKVSHHRRETADGSTFSVGGISQCAIDAPSPVAP